MHVDIPASGYYVTSVVMIAQPLFSKSPRTSTTAVNSIELFSAPQRTSDTPFNYKYTSYSDYTASLSRNQAKSKQSMSETIRQANKTAILAVGEELRVLLHEEDPPMIKDRRFHLRTYQQCFVGSEMVDWLLKKGEVVSRPEAVQMMQKLVDYGVMHHGKKQLAATNIVILSASGWHLNL